MELEHTSFTGLIPEQPRPTDYIAGVNSPLTAAVVMPSGDWRQYISAGEKQSIPFETFNCTAFSLTNIVEVWLNYFIATGQMPVGHLQFLQDESYLDGDGKVNTGERALGAMAGTTENGNRLTTVVDTARKFGLASNKLWPFGGSNLKEYFQTPPQQVFDHAKRFLDYFQINYEWFYNSPGTYVEAIKECPLWVALVTCGGWNNPPVQWCKAEGTNHAVSLVKYDNKTGPIIYDSYQPFLKELALDYQIPYALKVFVTINPKSMTKKYRIKDGSKLGVAIIEGETGVIQFAPDMDSYAKLKEVAKIDDATPQIELP